MFSPLGNQPLFMTKTADAANASAGGADGYTITITNPNGAAATLNSISDTLPAGFTYTPGSTTGATTADPTIAAGTLTWGGPIAVAPGGTASLHFGVTVSSTPGTYTNQASADAGADTVAGTGPTAPVTVIVSPGLRPNEIKGVFRAARPSFRACAQAMFTRTPGVSGTITMKLKVTPEGTVAALSSDAPAAFDATFTRCMEKVTQELAFPATGAEVSVTYPLVITQD